MSGQQRRVRLRPRSLIVAVLLTCAAAQCEAAPDAALAPFRPLYVKPDIFLPSLRQLRTLQITPRKVSGMTVPHHLVAADLIARAFKIAGKNRYDKIVILFPDHFKKTSRPFATTRRPFETVFGRVPVHRRDVAHLLRDAGLIEESTLFEKDHGIGALLPYVRYFFADTPIVPIAISVKSQKHEWDEFIERLAPIVTARTLIVQSTDFSHYLTHHQAIQRDQEVLNILAAGDVEAIAGLSQPDHLDSRGGQYIQMRLQARHFRSQPLVVANSNSQVYDDTPSSQTTSYIVQIYPSREELATAHRSDSSAQIYCIAGDTFFGRHLRPLLSRVDAAERLRKEIRARLGDCPLILNLEGVLVREVPDELGPMTLAMPAQSTVEWLRALNVIGVSLANNHARDLGDAAFAEMTAMLEASGIRALRHGEINDFSLFRLVALTDLDNNPEPRRELVTPEDLERVGRSDARPPLIAFLHWGAQYQSSPGARERGLADELRRKAVSLIVGAHPHRASRRITALAGGEAQLAYSLGNFLFDQRGSQASGAVLEVRFFAQGTFFTRLVPIPNLYDRARGVR